MDIQFQSAGLADTDTILDLMRAYYAFEKLPFDPAAARSAVHELLAHPDYGVITFIKEGPLVVGYYCLTYSYSLQYQGRDCILDEFFIRNAFRKKGIGTLALTHMEEELKENGFKAFHLLVFDHNEEAFRFYEKHGFNRQSGSFMSKTLPGE